MGKEAQCPIYQTPSAALKSSGKREDLSLVLSDRPAAGAGCFTQNRVCAAPVTYCKQALEAMGYEGVRAVLTNAGQANAATGEQGWEDSLSGAQAAADALGVPRDAVMVMSTGVIGQRIKMEPYLASIPDAVAALGSSAEHGTAAAEAITTTDLARKQVAVRVSLPSGGSVSIGGMAKGSGMIHPNMATMLGVVTTDAAVAPEAWRKMLRAAVARSYNQITVDGDTSTNDTVIGLANGAAAEGGVQPISDADSADGAALTAALTAVCEALAKSIAWDGEGATVLIEASVTGAASDADAREIAKSVCGSSLVKSAVYGRDPNWGRIAAAAGYAGVEFDQADLSVWLGEAQLMSRGQPLEFDESAASKYMADAGDCRGTVRIGVRVGDGSGSGKAWGCDLSYDYVKINAEYTT